MYKNKPDYDLLHTVPETTDKYLSFKTNPTFVAQTVWKWEQIKESRSWDYNGKFAFWGKIGYLFKSL